ncbi:hypothetical protein [Curtobacterium sp. Leaf261]|uniref:hypothetical protein n=1 Tax=Curtobacterium sp. Leaf261 TaxID=1736311 RepID=UPI0006F6737C|nr:hypothetical protein [Curtobacterium sp. Leaf261]KQO63537.1 hypothetical protein ASF23_04670 [Curtobacterium sp. Leaf261]
MVHPLPILSEHDARSNDVSVSTMHRAAAAGQLHRVAPARFVTASNWTAAGPRQRAVTNIHAALDRVDAELVVSHWSAAAMLGLPALRGWPETVEVYDSRAARTRRVGMTLRRPGVPPRRDLRSIDGLIVTSLARTSIDLALTAPFADAVAVLDAALAAGLDAEALVHVLSERPAARRRRTARDAVDFADPLAGSAAESFTRVGLAEMGAPRPTLQHEFTTRSGTRTVDFWFPDQGVALEFDGRAKYTQERYLQGRSPVDVFVAEKRRHEDLMACSGLRELVRIEWRDVDAPARLVERLRAAGVPCSGAPVLWHRG